MSQPTVRKQDPYVPLTQDQFRERFFARFYDPAFDAVTPELEKVFEMAWDGYIKYRKAPRTRPAGPGFADPDVRAVGRMARDARSRSTRRRRASRIPASPSRILIVNGSTRSEHTCPGEISKTRRLVQARARARSRRCPASRSTSSTSPRSPTSRGR